MAPFHIVLGMAHLRERPVPAGSSGNRDSSRRDRPTADSAREGLAEGVRDLHAAPVGRDLNLVLELHTLRLVLGTEVGLEAEHHPGPDLAVRVRRMRIVGERRAWTLVVEAGR